MWNSLWCAAWRSRTWGIVLSVALTLAGCGGGGVIPSPGVGNLRAVPAAVLGEMAAAYSPFRTSNRDTEVITRAMILEDLQLLEQAGIGWIRLFDSSDQVARQTLEVIRQEGLSLRVMLGMYVNPNAEEANQAEIARGIALANEYRDIVVAVSVGNETLVSWSFVPQTTATMARYLRQVRQAVTQPVTTDDNWAFFAGTQGVNPPADVLAEIDFVAMHSYPLLDTIFNPNLWNWRQTSVPEAERAQAMMDAGFERLRFEYQAVRRNLDNLGYGAMPVIIGETGWKAEASGGETQRAHPVNQKMYFDRVEAWRRSGQGPAAVVHFEAFDEPWKQGDDKWGLFNVQRQARCVAQALNASLTPAAGSCAPTEALYYRPTGSGEAITANRYTVYAEVATAGEARTNTPVLNAWENGTTANAVEVGESSGDGTLAMQINPTPQPWGWGMTWSESGSEVDLSNFQGEAARLNFRVKTTYAGQIEVGFLTGSTADGTAWDVYRAISPGQYGYNNDGQWHLVSIPVADLIARGAMAFGMTDPTLSRLQMNRVSNVFVLADRYGVTGKGDNANVRTPILIDDIHWTR